MSINESENEPSDTSRLRNRAAWDNAGRDLTRAKLVAEMEKIKNFQGIFGNITYKPFDPHDPASRQGQHSVFLIQCMKEGESKILTDWITAEH